MKIAVNTRLLVPSKMDGIGRFAYETLLRITKDHPEHHFTLLFDRKIEAQAFNFPANTNIVSLAPPARHPILWYIWFEWVLKRYLNKHDFDLFLSPEGWVPGGLKCRSLAVIHDLNFEHHPENIIFSHRKFLQHYFPKYVRRAERIATVSEYSKKDIEQCYEVDPSIIDVVYNGANTVFSPISSELQQEQRDKYANGERYFLFIGTLHPRKNLEHLFLAFDDFKKASGSPIKLLVAGNKKWWPKELEGIYQHMQFKQDLIFLGRLNDEELAVVLGGASALTYLPYFEGFGIPILEAFQARIPVITSNVTSMPEVADDAALLCNPRDVKEIANAMNSVLEEREKVGRLVEKGEKRAGDFSWEKTADLLWESMLKTL
jgi:glycosyltransferase involved in cell wall biosynthesis